MSARAVGTRERNADTEHHMKPRKRLSSQSWMKFLVERPSTTFIYWTRRVLLVWWLTLLLLEGPRVVRRFNEIRATTIPGFDRPGALQRLVADASVELLVLPALLVAMLGYGISVDRTAVFTGGRWFRSWWPKEPKSRPNDRL